MNNVTSKINSQREEKLDLPETKPLSEEKKLNARTMCCCVCAALTSLAQVPSAATEQRVLWDRLGASHCALAVGISQERNWDAEQQTHPGTWLGVHPAEVWAPPRDTGTLLGSRSSHRQLQLLVHAGMGGPGKDQDPGK